MDSLPKQTLILPNRNPMQQSCTCMATSSHSPRRCCGNLCLNSCEQVSFLHPRPHFRVSSIAVNLPVQGVDHTIPQWFVRMPALLSRRQTADIDRARVKATFIVQSCRAANFMQSWDLMEWARDGILFNAVMPREWEFLGSDIKLLFCQWVIDPFSSRTSTC